MAVIDLGCFPWHGVLELSALTVAEASVDPTLIHPAEVAAWRHYNFAAHGIAWRSAARLGREMAAAYHTCGRLERPDMAVTFLRACAFACASPEVASPLYSLAGVQLRVLHPDTGVMFWPPPTTSA